MTPAIHSAIREKKKAFYYCKENGRPNEVNNFFLCDFFLLQLNREDKLELKLLNAGMLKNYIYLKQENQTPPYFIS